MSWFKRKPETDVAPKPCIGCGYCCQKAPCALVQSMFDYQIERCPALQFDDGRYWCGLLRGTTDEERKRRMKILAIGEGCSSSLFNNARDQMLRRMYEEGRKKEVVQ